MEGGTLYIVNKGREGLRGRRLREGRGVRGGGGYGRERVGEVEFRGGGEGLGETLERH